MLGIIGLGVGVIALGYSIISNISNNRRNRQYSERAIGRLDEMDKARRNDKPAAYVDASGSFIQSMASDEFVVRSVPPSSGSFDVLQRLAEPLDVRGQTVSFSPNGTPEIHPLPEGPPSHEQPDDEGEGDEKKDSD